MWLSVWQCQLVLHVAEHAVDALLGSGEDVGVELHADVVAVLTDGGFDGGARAHAVIEHGHAGVGVGADKVAEQGDGLLCWVILAFQLSVMSKWQDGEWLIVGAIVDGDGAAIPLGIVVGARLLSATGGVRPSRSILRMVDHGGFGRAPHLRGGGWREYEDVLVVLHRTEAAVQMARALLLLPYPFVFQPRQVRRAQGDAEWYLRKEHDGSARTDDAAVFDPQGIERDRAIPLVARSAVGQVAEDEVNGMVGDVAHQAQAVAAEEGIEHGEVKKFKELKVSVNSEQLTVNNWLRAVESLASDWRC